MVFFGKVKKNFKFSLVSISSATLGGGDEQGTLFLSKIRFPRRNFFFKNKKNKKQISYRGFQLFFSIFKNHTMGVLDMFDHVFKG